jgi:hypothetical protein
MREQERIISFTPGIEATVRRAQRMANLKGEPYGVWEHVGLYGHPSGDIRGQHTFKILAFSRPDPEDVYALVACVDPEPSSDSAV